MAAPLRICLVASSRFPVAEPFMGGLEAHTHALASALVARGHRVTVFAGPGSDPGLGVRELPVACFSSSPAARADVGVVPEDWIREHHAYLELMLGLADGSHGEFDVVHNNSLHHLPIAMSRMLRVPVVTTLHTPPVAWLESAVRFAHPNCEFLAVSGSVARAWSRVTRAQVVHNGVDTARWTLGPGGGPAVWTGRLVPEKAPHEAIDAARRAGVALDLAGPVHDEAYFVREVQPRLGEGVRYLGHLQGAALVELVRGASVALVTPRWDEPFGLVAAEALACGTPVAAYLAGGLAEIVSPRVGRLVPQGDVDALARALAVASELDRRTARRHAVERFGTERMVEAYERVYRRAGVREGVA